MPRAARQRARTVSRQSSCRIAALFVGPATMYYTYFSIIEIATTATIVWIALKKWKIDP